MDLITGASGSVGGAVLAEAAKRSDKVRAMFRSAKDAAGLPAGTEAVIADFSDAASLAAALRGVESVFLVCAPVPDLVKLESAMIDACVRAGVRRVVLNSALGAGEYPKSFPSWHRKVEDTLKASGLRWCILRPNSFMQNILNYYAPSVRAQGAFYNALGGAKMSYLDVRDIAAVAAAALKGGVHDGKTYELNGPEALSCEAVADKISRAAGVPANYVAIPEDAQGKAMLDMKMPAWQVDALLDLQRYYTDGAGGTVDGVLEGLLGRRPTTLDSFLKEFSDRFRAPAAKA